MTYSKTFSVCSIFECGGELFWRSLCDEHRSALPAVCVLDECDKPTHSIGLCAMHGFRLRTHGNVNKTMRTFTEGIVHGTPAGYKHFGCRCDECREARRLSEIASRARNPETSRAASERARKNNPERMREYRRKWKQQNPEKVRGYGKPRSAMRFDDEAVAYSTLILRDPCVFCGVKNVETDHIVPIRDGGTSDWANLAPACDSCNSSKGAKSLLDFLLYRLERA